MRILSPVLFSNRIALIVIAGVLAVVVAIIIVTRIRTLNGESTRSTTTQHPPTSSPPQSSSAPPTLPSDVSSQSPVSSSEPNRSPVSLANGTDIIRPKGSRGRGTLKITNGTNRDATVRLADSGSKKTRRLVYVRANSEFTIGNIGTCNCILQFSAGTDWEKTKRKFLRDQSYSQFDELFEFRETRTEYGVEWAVFEVTLNPVVDGNARPTSINEKDFEDNEIDERP